MPARRVQCGKARFSRFAEPPPNFCKVPARRVQCGKARFGRFAEPPPNFCKVPARRVQCGKARFGRFAEPPPNFCKVTAFLPNFTHRRPNLTFSGIGINIVNFASRRFLPHAECAECFLGEDAEWG